MTFNLLAVIVFMAVFTTKVFFARYFLEFKVPREVRNYYDKQAFAIRRYFILFIEIYFPDRKHFGTVMLTRVVFPMICMLYVYQIFHMILNIFVYSHLILTTMFVFLMDVYILLNATPSLDDLAYLFDADRKSRWIWGAKLGLIIMLYTHLNPLLMVTFLLTPLQVPAPIATKFKISTVTDQHIIPAAKL